MTKQPLQKPTASELEILRVLWERGPSTVRDVHEALREKKDLGYTTVLKLLQIMTEKRLVRRDESARTHVYAAACSQEQTERQLVTDLMNRVFGGSAARLVLQALAARKASPEELAEIRKLIDTQRGGGR